MQLLKQKYSLPAGSLSYQESILHVGDRNETSDNALHIAAKIRMANQYVADLLNASKNIDIIEEPTGLGSIAQIAHGEFLVISPRWSRPLQGFHETLDAAAMRERILETTDVRLGQLIFVLKGVPDLPIIEYAANLSSTIEYSNYEKSILRAEGSLISKFDFLHGLLDSWFPPKKKPEIHTWFNLMATYRQPIVVKRVYRMEKLDFGHHLINLGANAGEEKE